MNSESLVIFFLAGTILVGLAIVFAYFISPKSWNASKFEAYECGIPSSGTSWIQFNVGYYIFAIIYLVFDVEIVFVFPFWVSMNFPKLPQPLLTPKLTSMFMFSFTVPIEGEFIELTYAILFSTQLFSVSFEQEKITNNSKLMISFGFMNFFF